MKRSVAIAVIVLASTLLVVAPLATGQRASADQAGGDQNPSALKETLEGLERQSWEAWKNRDGKFFSEFLSDDHVEIHPTGIANKATVVAGVASPICVVKSYAVDNFTLTVFDANAALLTYHAAQDTACNGKPVPSPVWASSLYVRRGGRWLNALYQHTPAAR